MLAAQKTGHVIQRYDLRKELLLILFLVNASSSPSLQVTKGLRGAAARSFALQGGRDGIGWDGRKRLRGGGKRRPGFFILTLDISAQEG